MTQKPTKKYELFATTGRARSPTATNSITLRADWVCLTALRAKSDNRDQSYAQKTDQIIAARGEPSTWLPRDGLVELSATLN